RSRRRTSRAWVRCCCRLWLWSWVGHLLADRCAPGPTAGLASVVPSMRVRPCPITTCGSAHPDRGARDGPWSATATERRHRRQPPRPIACGPRHSDRALARAARQIGLEVDPAPGQGRRLAGKQIGGPYPLHPARPNRRTWQRRTVSRDLPRRDRIRRQVTLAVLGSLRHSRVVLADTGHCRTCLVRRDRVPAGALVEFVTAHGLGAVDLVWSLIADHEVISFSLWSPSSVSTRPVGLSDRCFVANHRPTVDGCTPS